jgi:hypothetical protein
MAGARGWGARSARLWTVRPVRRKLADYLEIPNSSVKHCGPANLAARLVALGTGTEAAEYEGKSILVKIVMASVYCGKVARITVKERGAA